MREGRIISINRQWWAYQSQWKKPVNTLLSSFAAKRKKYEIQNFLRNFRMSMSSVVQNACTCMEISCRKLLFFLFSVGRIIVIIITAIPFHAQKGNRKNRGAKGKIDLFWLPFGKSVNWSGVLWLDNNSFYAQNIVHID